MNNIEVTPELVDTITRAVRAWKRETIPHESEDQHFDTYCKEEHGLDVEFGQNGHVVVILGATIIDEEKYINFLLRFGNMPNE
jgi:hypothetical protein